MSTDGEAMMRVQYECGIIPVGLAHLRLSVTTAIEVFSFLNLKHMLHHKDILYRRHLSS
jgi:hypothetical protein